MRHYNGLKHNGLKRRIDSDFSKFAARGAYRDELVLHFGVKNASAFDANQTMLPMDRAIIVMVPLSSLGVVMRLFVGCAAGALALAGQAFAAILVLDFDAFAAGTIINNQYPGVTISAANPPINLAITFDSDNPSGGDGDLGQPLTRVGGDVVGAGPMNNVLIFSEDGDLTDPDDDAGGGVFNFDFDDAIIFLGFDALDITDNGANLLVRLYAGDDITEIFTFDFASVVGALVGDNEYWSLFSSYFGAGGVAGVGRAEIQLTGSGAIDNLTYDPIPGPAALPLLLTGLAGLGFAARRKRRAS